MLKVSTLIIATMLITSPLFAETYVLHKGDDILGMSSRNDIVPGEGESIKVLDKNFDQLGITRDVRYYKLSSNSVVLNTQKVLAHEKALVEMEKKKDKKKELRESAIQKLVTLGLTDEEISALLKI